MEFRDDLLKILLEGLPPDERAHTLHAIAGVDADKLLRIRASNANTERQMQLRLARQKSAQEAGLEGGQTAPQTA